jgi:membrane protease YdiL (CAAX protease family)
LFIFSLFLSIRPAYLGKIATVTPSLQTGRLAHKSFLHRHSVTAYFLLTFAISWLGAFLVSAPHLLRGQSLPQMTGILMFPAMLLGPSLAGIFLTWFLDGQSGLRDLFSRMRRIRFPARWYTALLIPPVLILSLLLCMKTFLSPVYSPNRFWLGLAFGIPAGFFEEIGWTGFAYPKMLRTLSPGRAALLLGLLWGLWHIPVINYLGTAVPHGAYWFPFFLAFAAAMAAMRILIAWAYSNTNSVLLAQLLHACSTGSLVIFSPPHVSAAQEAFWYAVYAAALWLVIIAFALVHRAARSSPTFPLSV